MTPISTPFQINRNTEGVELTGIDGRTFREFIRLCSDYCKLGKIYHFSIKEITASEAQKNYLFLCLSMAAEETGQTTESMRTYFENTAYKMALDEQDDFFNESDWIAHIIDLDGVVQGKALITMSSWTTSMMYDFIQLIQGIFLRQYPNFIFPNPEDYTLPRKGRKNILPFPELKMIVRF